MNKRKKKKKKIKRVRKKSENKEPLPPKQSAVCLITKTRCTKIFYGNDLYSTQLTAFIITFIQSSNIELPKRLTIGFCGFQIKIYLW